MGRFSEMFKDGYNKSVIDKAKLKDGDKIKIHGIYNLNSTFMSVNDSGITAFQDAGRDYPKRFVFDKTAMGVGHTELLLKVEGIAPENITLYSCNPEAYKKHDKTYERLVSSVTEAGAIVKSIADLTTLSDNQIPVLIELKKPIQLEGSEKRYNAHEEIYELSPTKLINYSLLGYLKDISRSQAPAQNITVSTDGLLRKVQDDFAKDYALLNYFTAPDRDITVAVEDIHTIYSLENIEDFKKAIEARKAEILTIDTLVVAGAVMLEQEKWSDLSVETGPVLIVVNDADDELKDYLGSYGIIQSVVAWSGMLSVSCSEELGTMYQRLSQRHEGISKFAALATKEISLDNIRAIYVVKDLATALDQPDSSLPDATGAEPDTPAVTEENPQAVPDLAFVPTPFNDALPSMIGFTEERIGIPRCEWTSPGYLLADRDLALNEVIRVWAVDRRDGRVLKVVALTATATNRTKDKWPAALVTAVRDDNTLVNDSKLLHAGVIKGTSFDVGTASHSTADCAAASSHADYNRLWVFSTHARLFTNAPFAANQVMAHNLANVDFKAAQRMCVQVRDRVSQGLLESIVVTFEADTTSAARARALCEAVKENSLVLRAGVLADDGISIALSDQGNALWVPQLSDLSVTVEPAPWVFYSNFTASRALELDEELRIYIHDDVTGMPLAGSPFTFTPGAEALDRCKWPAALAKTLKTSVLADYLVLALAVGSEATTGEWKCAGVPLRILMGAPLEENSEWVPMLSETGQSDQAITINEKLLHLISLKKRADADALKAGYYLENRRTFIPLELVLRDARTGCVCYSWALVFMVDQPNKVQAFTRELMDDMRHRGVFAKIYRADQAPGNQSESPEETGVFYLQKKLGMTGELRLQAPTELLRLMAKPEIKSIQATHVREYSEAEDVVMSVVQGPPKSQDLIFSRLDEIEKSDRFSGFSRRFARLVKRASMKGNDFNNRLRDHVIDSVFNRFKAEGIEFIEDIEEFKDFECFEYFEVFEDIDYGEYHSDEKSSIILNRHEELSRASTQIFLSDRTVILPRRSLQLQLESEALSEGLRFIWVQNTDKGVLVSTPALSAGSLRVVGAHFTTESPWDQPFCVDVDKPKDYIASFKPDNTLCADRCMTLGAHVYDTGGSRENGVDENTGLFHAHYPLATLRGLEGKGPELDLTLHYSAVRANEGALGDGWAFRFSYFDNRRRVLTLSSGQTLTLTKAQMKSLSADRTRFLDQDGYRITAVEGDEQAWTALTVQMPVGTAARQEVLQLPQTHDGNEAGEAFKSTYKKKLERIIANLTQWIDKEKITSAKIQDLKKQREAWKAELADIDRNSLVLVTSSIRSPEGGELKLAWQGIEGHIRLDSITDTATDTVLLQASHGAVVAQGSSQSVFTVWPGTAESYQLTLTIRNCLLESIKRHRTGESLAAERDVRFGYEPDSALDRVLTSIAEEDGSLETVRYWVGDGDIAPRVQAHMLVPGAGQKCICHSYEWKGDYCIEQLRKLNRFLDKKSAEPFVLTNWTFNGGVRVVDSIVEEQPGSSRRTTRFTYPATAPASDYQHLILSRPIKTEVTTETLISD